MGFELDRQGMDELLRAWSAEYIMYAPVRVKDGGCFSDTDCVRYGEVKNIGDIVFDEKSQYSFKEVLLPIVQTLFFFTEDEVKEADGPKKEVILFLRSCDLHAVRRLDDMYLRNGPADMYYARLRDKIHFVLMGCPQAFPGCFCTSMGTNRCDSYDLSLDAADGVYRLDCRENAWQPVLERLAKRTLPVEPACVQTCPTEIHLPEKLTAKVAQSKIWEEYDGRCIGCGRCNFVCPTCTCYTMQDLFYTENGRVGERRRVWASCMVDGFTDVAGGGSYRRTNGQRMRFKVLHKILDFRRRFGCDMCVGCGRCDAVCPEYISFSHILGRLEEAVKEVGQDDQK